MIRLIVKVVDFGEAAHVTGAQVSVRMKSFDCDLPELEAFLIANRSTWQSAELVSIEELADNPQGRGDAVAI